jgi:AcrR family transcriptional regulator
MVVEVASIRERQAQQVRDAVLDAAVAALETTAVDELSMADIAKSAGISLRTLYRYYPDRASLLAAAGEHLYAALGVPFEIAAPDDIAASFRDAARRLATRPRLARVLVQTRAGRAARSGVRSQRLEAIRAALAPLAEDLEPGRARRAEAVIAHLCSVTAWVSVADESGLADAEAQAAVGWAIEALVDALRQADGRARRRPHHDLEEPT